MAWVRKRKRGWACWAGVVLCGVLAVVWCLASRSSIFRVADNAGGADWVIHASTYCGSVVAEYNYERRLTMQQFLIHTPGSRYPRYMDGPRYWPRLKLGDLDGFVRLPMWMIGVVGVAACGGVVAITRRRWSFFSGGVAWAGCVLLAGSIASLFINSSDRMFEIGRRGSTTVGAACDRGGFLVWCGDETGLDADEIRDRRWNALGAFEREFERPWRFGASRDRSGWWWMHTEKVSINLGTLTEYEYAFVSWWVIAGVVGLPTVFACWRSRWVRESTGCPACGYSREGLRSGVCPECGETSGGGA